MATAPPLASVDEAPPPLALQQRAYSTQLPRKPDVLDKTVTFLAKRDGIDKARPPCLCVCAGVELARCATCLPSCLSMGSAWHTRFSRDALPLHQPPRLPASHSFRYWTVTI